ncbi:MAG: MarR family winged helix-turn-helix transcriptional regulator [Gammaproteobacteria bacterium]
MKPLDLAGFLPYRISVLANRISSRLANVYADRFDLTIPEWRVMAVLGQFDGVSADFVCTKTEMDRVTVSRAVARLLRKRYISRRFHVEDRRRSRLSLAAAGRQVYAEVVPLARRYEAALRQGIDTADLARFDAVIGRLQERIGELDASVL